MDTYKANVHFCDVFVKCGSPLQPAATLPRELNSFLVLLPALAAGGLCGSQPYQLLPGLCSHTVPPLTSHRQSLSCQAFHSPYPDLLNVSASLMSLFRLLYLHQQMKMASLISINSPLFLSLSKIIFFISKTELQIERGR